MWGNICPLRDVLGHYAVGCIGVVEHAIGRGNLPGTALEMGMRCKEGALLCARLPEGYYLVLLLAPAAQVSRAYIELRRVAVRLAEHL